MTTNTIQQLHQRAALTARSRFDCHEGEVAVLVGEGLGGFVADAHGPAGAHVRGGASETEESALRALCEALESGSLA